MEKTFWYSHDSIERSSTGKVRAENREAAEKKVLEAFGPANVTIRSYAGVLDERIRNYIDKIAVTAIFPDKLQERLRCCADAALMFGEESQESLGGVLGRAVDCGWEITGLDSHMFSFGFKSPKGGFWGGIIFHCNDKTWSAHT
jgi:hypothetical protein